MPVLIFILILSFLVLIHELGHFVAALWAKIKVDEFGIGYPPKAIRLFRWRDTDFTLNWVPFGGFVRMQGEDPEERQDAHAVGQFYQATRLQRLVVILAGASVNFLFGILAFSIVFSILGIPLVIPDARIAAISPGSPAEQAQIPVGVSIRSLEIEGKNYPTATVEDVVSIISEHKGETARIETSGPCQGLDCEKSSHYFSAYLRTTEETPADQGSLGVVFDQVQYQRFPWWQMIPRSVWYGTTQALMLGYEIYKALGGMLVSVFKYGNVPGELAGPVGIVHQAQQSGIFAEGLLTLLSFAGMLSVNLAIMNVLPIAPLDGGRALFIVLEVIFPKSIVTRLEHFSIRIGYVALLALIVGITIKDVLNLFM